MIIDSAVDRAWKFAHSDEGKAAANALLRSETFVSQAIAKSAKQFGYSFAGQRMIDYDLRCDIGGIIQGDARARAMLELVDMHQGMHECKTVAELIQHYADKDAAL